MTNEDIQRGLAAAGFYTGKIDGVIGPKTRAAAMGFRTKYGLEVDVGSGMATKLAAVTSAPPISGVPVGAMTLLHFIAQAEAGGNYNAYYRHAKSMVPLVTYTLAGIQSFQSQMLATGAKSTAVGAYQFLKGTLAQLVHDLNMDLESTLFSTDIQDTLAFKLLIGRGWNRYAAGQLTAAEFGLAVSKEWASMPNPHTGRSYYDGDGLNSALVGTQEFLDVVNGAIK